MFEKPHLSFFLGGSRGFLLAPNVNTIMLKIPLFKRCCIYLNNCTPHQGLGSNQLIVGSIINYIQDPSFPSGSLTPPWEITSVQPQSTPLHVPTSNPNPPHSLVARQFRVCWLSSKLVPFSNKPRPRARKHKRFIREKNWQGTNLKWGPKQIWDTNWVVN